MKQAKHLTLKIEGMGCAGCSSKIQAALLKKPGIEQASVDHASGKAEVGFDPNQLSEEAIREAIENLGYDVVP